MQRGSVQLHHTVRSAKASDLAGIRFVDPLMRADPERAHLIQSALTGGRCVVAADGDEVLGFAILTYIRFRHGFVPLLVVGIGSRRTGIGRAPIAEPQMRCVGTPILLDAPVMR